MRRALRLLGLLLALGLMGGEFWRSWGAGRPLPFVLDDFVFGGLLLAGVVAARPGSARGLRLLAAGFAGCAGMTYGSFFDKLMRPETMETGNWDGGVLTALVGLTFALGVAGTAGALVGAPGPRVSA